jgi:hypothetical protein
MAQFTYEVELTGPGSSPWIPLEAHGQYTLPEGVQINGKVDTLLITVNPSGGSSKIEFTTAPISKVYDNPSALNEVTWSPGLVSTRTFHSMPAPTAFRVVCSSGTVQVSARGI